MCPHLDSLCPCPDGDACHYATYGDSGAMPCPISGIVGCPEDHRNTGEGEA